MDNNTHKIRVGIARGGISSEYEVSLKTGAAVLKNLPDKYIPYDILITKDGVWHINGVPTNIDKLRDKVDVVFNALHGAYGEDGKVQRKFEELSIPYTGSGPVASAIGMNKALAKKSFRVGDEINPVRESPIFSSKNLPEYREQLHVLSNGIKTPLYKTVRKNDDLNKAVTEIWRSFPQPSIIKPLSGGSSIGVSVARTFPGITEGINKVFDSGDDAIIEEYINGREVFCGAVSDFRGEKVYVLPPVEIIGSEKMDFLDYGKKSGSENIDIASPSQLSKKEKETISEAVKRIYQNLSLRDYAGFDFIVSKRGIYLLEVNTLPGLTDASFLPKALDSVGAKLPQFLDHVITLAVQRK